MNLRIFALVTLLFSAVMIAAPMPAFSFQAVAGKTGHDGISLFNGSRLAENGAIVIPNAAETGSAFVEPLADWELGQEGFTAVITVKSDRPQHLAFFGKKGVFTLRQSAVPGPGMILFVGEEDKAETTHQLPWNLQFSPGKYVQYAVSARYIDNPATGQIGYEFAVYANGQLRDKRLLYNLKPGQGKGGFWLGNDPKTGFFLGGEILDFAFYRTALNDGEISGLAEANPYIRQQRESETLKLPTKYQATLTPADGDTPESQWLKSALARAFFNGATEAKLDTVLPLLPVAFDDSAISSFNSSQTWYRLVATTDILWLLSLQGGTEAVMAGAFDKRTGRELSGRRLLGWRLESSQGEISDQSHGISAEIADFTENDGTATFNIVWRFQALTMTSHVTLAGKRMEADFRVDNPDASLKLDRVFYPMFRVRPPSENGLMCISASFSGNLGKVNLLNGYRFGSDYPSEVSMQFRGLYDADGNGIYLGFEEASPLVKKFGGGGEDGDYRYDAATTCELAVGAKGGNSYATRGPAVLELYQGHWYEAGQIYKRFLLSRADWFVRKLPRSDTPKWYRENNLTIIGGSADEVIYLREYLGLPFLSDRTGFWYDIDTSQPLPYMVHTTKDAYNSFESIKRIKKAGIRMTAYINPRLWDFAQHHKPRVDDYALQAAIKHSDGSPHLEKYGSMVAVVCPMSSLMHQVVVDNVRRMVENFDCIYLDQTIDAHSLPCFDANHGHALNSPYFWHQGYFQMMDELRREARRINPDAVFCGEGGDDVWCTRMDGYLTWLYGLTGHVPLIQSIYGGGRVQFVGRGFESFGGGGDWDAFFCRLGEQFVNSEQLGWFNINDFRFGARRRRFVKKLMHLRLGVVSFFTESNMLAPLEFTTPMPQITCNWQCLVPRMVTTDKVVHAVWRRQDGKILIPFVNTTVETVKIQPVLPFRGKLFVCREGSRNVEEYAAAEPPALELGAHEAQFWFVDEQGGSVPPEAIATAQVMPKVVTFDDGKNLCFGQNFQACLRLDGTTGEWFTAEQASWLKQVFREVTPTLAYTPAKKDLVTAGNWLLSEDGGLAFYGEVDFGQQPKGVEVEVSAMSEGAGSRLKLVAMQGQEPGTTLASAVVPDTGKYFDFQTIRLELPDDYAGVHKVAWSFEKPVVLRRWRVLQ